MCWFSQHTRGSEAKGEAGTRHTAPGDETSFRSAPIVGVGSRLGKPTGVDTHVIHLFVETRDLMGLGR